MLKPLGLTYKVEDEVLLITSPQASMASTYPKPYYVGDLIMPPNRADTARPAGRRGRPRPARRRPDRRLPAQAAADGSGASPTGRRAAERRRRASPTATGPQVDMTPLIQLITVVDRPGHLAGHRQPRATDVSAAYGMGGGFGGGAGGGVGRRRTSRSARSPRSS